MFIPTLFTIPRTCKQSKCLSTEESIKKMLYIYIYILEYYSAMKNEIMPFAATWMGIETVLLSKVRQRKISIICYQLNVESLKIVRLNLSTKQR